MAHIEVGVSGGGLYNVPGYFPGQFKNSRASSGKHTIQHCTNVPRQLLKPQVSVLVSIGTRPSRNCSCCRLLLSKLPILSFIASSTPFLWSKELTDCQLRSALYPGLANSPYLLSFVLRDSNSPVLIPPPPLRCLMT